MTNKVTVIGFTGSGKTTYLTGMYICMSSGVKHFSLLAKDKSMDLYLENLWDMLCDGKRPDPSDKLESYDFHIAHNYKPVCDFEWLDYPGGILAEPNHLYREKLESDIKDSDCLLLIVDGELLSGINAVDTDDYRNKLEKKLKLDSGIRKEVKMFTQLSAEKIILPPIGIVITKCDLIDPEYQDAVRSAIRNSFAELFDEPERIVLPMTVSLGGAIEDGFVPDPYCIEQPIAFAVLSILLKYISALQLQKNENKDFVSKHSSFLGGLLNANKVNRAQENIKELGESVDKWSNDAFSLIELFSEKKKIYVGGIERNLRDYYRNKFQLLSNGMTERRSYDIKRYASSSCKDI